MFAFSIMALAIAGGLEVLPRLIHHPDLQEALNESVADSANDEKSTRLHDALMKSNVYFEVPDADSAEFKADGYHFKGENWRFVGVQPPGHTYKSILIFTSISAAKRTPNPFRYAVAVTGRQVFEFARANGFGVVLNTDSKPTIEWSPEFVTDYLR